MQFRRRLAETDAVIAHHDQRRHEHDRSNAWKAPLAAKPEIFNWAR
jgi:hypothetical protein